MSRFSLIKYYGVVDTFLELYSEIVGKCSSNRYKCNLNKNNLFFDESGYLYTKINVQENAFLDNLLHNLD